MSDLLPIDERDRDWLCDLLDEPQRAVEHADRESVSEAGTRCEYLAVLGLLPEALEPVAASAELEERIVAAVRDRERSRPRPLPLAPGTGPIVLAARRWLLPVAATLAFAALGLSAWQTARLAELRSVVARQEAELAAARELADRLATMEGAAADQAAALSLLTAAGAEFCPLRPPAASPTPEARGTLAMSEDGSHWYLRVVGLEPREDREYRLWFLRDGDPLHGAVLRPIGGDALELMNGEAPEGFNAVVITLEPTGSERPSGPRLLFGNERMRLL